jgi:hypothetical protein
MMRRANSHLIALAAAGACVAVALNVPASSATPAGGPAASHHASSKPRPAPAALTAVTLIKKAKLKAALHTKVSPTQANGGVAPYPTLFESQAEVETKLTTLTVSLFTDKTVKDAKQTYQSEAGTVAHHYKGIGAQASSQSDGQVTVRTGAQVLVVFPGLTPAGETYVADHGKSPASLQKTLYGPALNSARALAKHLAGKLLKGNYVELPHGALAPCISAAAFKKQTHKPVTIVPMNLSNSPPAQQCNYTIGGKPFLDTTYTARQAKTALTAGTPAQIYASDRAAAAGKQVEHATVGPVKAFMVEDADWHVDFLVSGSAHHASPFGKGGGGAASAASSHGLLLTKVLNGYTYTVDYNDCLITMLAAIGNLLGPSLNNLGPAGKQDARKLKRDTQKWCHDMTGQ